MQIGIDPHTMPYGFVAPGLDKSLYVVNKKREWELFKRAICKTYFDEETNEFIMYMDYPEVDEYPDIIIENTSSPVEGICDYDYSKEEKRSRGRPRKEVNPQNTNRYGRAPTKYNMFLRERMSTLAHIKGAREKMAIIAKEWAIAKISETSI